MIKSGTDFEVITARIATLQTELDLLGSPGLYNLNKHCEGFVCRLLNMTYDLGLINLNKHVVNYPGLDLGDKEAKVAYQVTSESGTGKIEDSLEKVIRHKLHETFSDVRFFLLRKKQKSYPLTLPLPPGFTFDPKTQIVSFSDLLKDIQHLSAETIADIRDFVESETSDTIEKIKRKPVAPVTTPLIDIAASLAEIKMNKYEHFSCKLTFANLNMFVPTLYKKLNDYFTGKRRDYFRILTPSFRKPSDPMQVTYHQPSRNTGVTNHFHEFAFRITDNSLHFEFAQYRSGDTLLTNLANEMGACLSLLFFLDRIRETKSLQIELEIDLACNDSLAFLPQNSPCAVQRSFTTYYLQAVPVNYSMVIISLDDSSLTRLVEGVIHKFVAQEPSFIEHSDPFLSIDELQQIQTFNWFRNLLA
jgi:hypothetical protein